MKTTETSMEPMEESIRTIKKSIKTIEKIDEHHGKIDNGHIDENHGNTRWRIHGKHDEQYGKWMKTMQQSMNTMDIWRNRWTTWKNWCMEKLMNIMEHSMKTMEQLWKQWKRNDENDGIIAEKIDKSMNTMKKVDEDFRNPWKPSKSMKSIEKNNESQRKMKDRSLQTPPKKIPNIFRTLIMSASLDWIGVERTFSNHDLPKCLQDRAIALKRLARGGQLIAVDKQILAAGHNWPPRLPRMAILRSNLSRFDLVFSHDIRYHHDIH